MIEITTGDFDNKYTYNFDDCESLFIAKIHSNQFGDDDIFAMRSIDHAELLDKNTGTIKTPFGVTGIENLSMGCKTVLVYLYIQRNKELFPDRVKIDVTGCGSNALSVLFDLMDKYDNHGIALFLNHNNDLYKCGYHDFIYNGRKCHRLY